MLPWVSSVSWANTPPAVLFLVQNKEMALFYELDRNYLYQLHREHGIHIDIEEVKNISIHRLKSYNAVVVYSEPGSANEAGGRYPGDPQRFARTIQDYVSQGGGVFLLPWLIQRTSPFPSLSKTFQFKLPHLSIVETDPARLGSLLRGSLPTPIAWTNRIFPSPVSHGVQQLWYLYGTTRYSRQTGILDVSSPVWQPVAAASDTAFAAIRSQLPNGTQIYRNTTQRSPVFFAIRTYGKGRVALLNTWYHGIFGQGTKWIFDRQILQLGHHNRPSHFHRLVVNTLQWLIQPSRQSGSWGGYRMDPSFFSATYPSAQQFAPWAEISWTEQRLRQYATVPSSRRIYRGIIGLRSTYSNGLSTLSQYKQVGLKQGIDFLIFLEDYTKLNPTKFQQLRDEAKRLSDDRILLIPGYRIQANIGNHLFFYGRALPWLPEKFVRQDGRLRLQPENAQGRFVFDMTLNRWLLHKIHGTLNMMGYYNLANSGPGAMQVKDFRLYSALGVRSYQGTRLIEDLERDYLQTTATGSPPTPLSITEIKQAAEIPQLLGSHVLLTHIAAKSLNALTTYGHLFWNNIYTAPEIFLSNGPRILRFAHTFFYRTYGASHGVTGRALQPVPIAITSPHPIQRIELYNHGHLFRSIRPDKETTTWVKTLLLPGNLQNNLVLKVVDSKGQMALSFPHRSVKDGHADVVFCGDHINDCVRNPILARGSFHLPLHFSPMLLVDEAGWGWDGGPVGSLDLVGMTPWNRVVTKNSGTVAFRRYNQTPIFHFSDEGSLGVQNILDEVFGQEFEQPPLPLNPWFGYAPKHKAKTITLTTQLRWIKPIPSQAPRDGHLFYGGSSMSLAFWYQWIFTFLQPTTVQTIELFGSDTHPPLPILFASSGYARGKQMVAIRDIQHREIPITLPPHGWFAFLSSTSGTNTHLFFNKSTRPFLIKLRKQRTQVDLRLSSDSSTRNYRTGEQQQAQLLSYAFGVKTPIHTLSHLRAYTAYVEDIPKPQMWQGILQDNRGLLRMMAHDGLVDFSLVQAPISVKDLGLPVQVKGLQPEWSAGLLQKQGYVSPVLQAAHLYGKRPHNRYRPLGVDTQGSAWFPLHVATSKHDIEAGHPVIAVWNKRRVQGISIQVTPIRDDPYQWYVSVNHLGRNTQAITFQLHLRMRLPHFPFRCRQVTLRPRQHLIISWFNRLHTSSLPCNIPP